MPPKRQKKRPDNINDEQSANEQLVNLATLDLTLVNPDIIDPSDLIVENNFDNDAQLLKAMLDAEEPTVPTTIIKHVESQKHEPRNLDFYIVHILKDHKSTRVLWSNGVEKIHPLNAPADHINCY